MGPSKRWTRTKSGIAAVHKLVEQETLVVALLPLLAEAAAVVALAVWAMRWLRLCRSARTKSARVVSTQTVQCML